MSIREITVYNANGQFYTLTTQAHFIHEVGGFGFVDDTELLRIGDDYTALTETVTPDSPSGSIFFSEPNAYEKYYAFSRFIRIAPLRLCYNPTGKQVYTMRARVRSLEKTELTEGGTGLNCAVEFAPLSMWIRTQNEFNDGSVTDGKTYTYRYSYTYTRDIIQSVTFTSDSYISSPTRIVMYGPLKNPSWVHYLNNVEKTRGAVAVEIPSNHRLVIDTTSMPYSIKEVDALNQLVADRYQQSDFSTERFVFLEYGENRISVSHESSGVIMLGVEAQIKYETV